MVCACTGLPPGELMRMTTPWVFLSLNAACSAVVIRSEIASVKIEKYSFLPIEFHRDVRATVEICMHGSPVADGKGRRPLAEVLNLEAHADARIGQRLRRTDQPCCISHRSSSGTLATQAR